MRPGPVPTVEDGSDESLVLVEIADRVATVTLNRPDHRNALSRALQRRLRAAVSTVEADDDVDVIVLTGADPTFCAGLDLKELGSGTLRPDGGESSGGGLAPTVPLPPHRKPVIGAINGAAVTGGFELALACDFLVASERASFADTHARIGVMPGWGLTVELPAAIGVRRAREMSVTGNFVDAEQALRWGLVNHVVDHAELIPFCRALAADIVSNDQEGVRQMLSTYDRASGADRATARAVESEVAAAWIRDRLAPGMVEARRRDVIERGRRQQ